MALRAGLFQTFNQAGMPVTIIMKFDRKPLRKAQPAIASKRER